jgi:hypothetical protein
MFEKLKNRWGVGGWGLFLILVTFACGGSACAYLGRKILGVVYPETGPLRTFLYILLVTVLWPFCVLIISIPLGQFRFFSNYLNRVAKRLFGKK